MFKTLKEKIKEKQNELIIVFLSFDIVSACSGATAIKLTLLRVKQESRKQINLLIIIQVWARDFDIRISDLWR
jgi:hypothetical protein